MNNFIERLIAVRCFFVYTILLSSALSSISWLTCFNSFSHAILASLYVEFSLMK
nr:MAG TPA: hypothetical protein [Caudoviricetes sp.]